MSETNRGPLSEAVFYILLSLLEPCHGYGIIKKTEKMSSGRIMLGAGTLYGALETLVSKGWIEPCGNVERRKLYQITAAGKETLRCEIERLEELSENGRRQLKENNNAAVPN